MISRRLRRFFSSRGPVEQPFRLSARRYLLATQSVRIFYVLSTYLAAAGASGLHNTLSTTTSWDPSWAVAWIPTTSRLAIVDIILLVAICSAIAATIRPSNLLFRLFFALAIGLRGAIDVSFGGINHVYHAWFWIAAILVFLPSGECRKSRMTYLLVISTAQALLLSFYSLAGFRKFSSGFGALVQGEFGNFSPGGLSSQLADRMLQTNTEPLLGPFMIENWWISWPGFLAIIYVQTVALVIAYRPNLHVLWGLFLILFHLGTFTMMEILFSANVVLILIFLVLSPFRPSDLPRLKDLRDIPIFGVVFRKLI